jgi:hypothetical protein
MKRLSSDASARRLVLIIVLVLSAACWQLRTAPGAAAAWWNTYSVTTCGSGYVGGQSVLEWSGYFVASEGQSWGTLWIFNGSSYVIAAQGYDSQRGVSNTANAIEYTYSTSNYFYTTGSHGSTWYSGFKSSSSWPAQYCP